MKKVMSLVLSLVLLVGLCSLTACGGEEAPAPEEPAGIALPFGLSFGMTYDEFAAKITEHGLTAPALEPATNNDGYFPDGVDLPLEDPTVWEFIGSETLKKYAAAKDVAVTDPLYLEKIPYDVSTPKLYGSFNRDQKLYEVYIGWNFTDEELAQTVCAELSATYNAFFGTDGKIDAVTGNWENEEYGVSFQNTGDITYLLVIHDFAHDLNA